jgi:UDP-3-O-[3-hydroxymyristoyl] N-acetylglucosamine deacetylase
MVDPKRTLVAEIEIAGIGLHTGAQAVVRVRHADPGAGRFFVRVDLPERPIVRAFSANVVDTTRSTTLGQGGASVRMTEHLLAALAAMGVDDACIEISGPEVPILDGSARAWGEAIFGASAPVNEARRDAVWLDAPIWIPSGDSFVAALPSAEMRFSCKIAFAAPAIGEQWHSFAPSSGAFLAEIAPARTFGLLGEVDALRERGMIAGASLDTGIVCDQTGWVNGPLRFPNEPARHKLLDLMGDLALVAPLPRAHYVAFKAGHALHVKLAAALCQMRMPAT